MKYIERPTDNPDHDEFYDREDHYYGRRPDNPIGSIYDPNSGEAIIVEFDGRTMDELLKPESITKTPKKRGVSDVSFKDVNTSCGISPNLAYTNKQAAEFLQLSGDTVMNFCKTRFWKCSAHRNAYRIKGSVILDWLDGK